MAVLGVIDSILNLYFNLLYSFPSAVRNGVEIIILGIGISLVVFFIWKFYNGISKRDLFELNLAKYNNSEHPSMEKFVAIILYILEYIIIIPILLLIWFCVLSFVILFIAKGITTFQILTVVASMLVAIRLLAYYRKEISEDLAKLFPFITLSVFLISSGEIDSTSIAQKIAEIPNFFDQILIFFFSVFVVEIILRIMYSITSLFSDDDSSEDK